MGPERHVKLFKNGRNQRLCAGSQDARRDIPGSIALSGAAPLRAVRFASGRRTPTACPQWLPPFRVSLPGASGHLQGPYAYRGLLAIASLSL